MRRVASDDPTHTRGAQPTNSHRIMFSDLEHNHVSVPLCFYLPLCVYLSLCLCLCLSISLSVSVCLSSLCLSQFLSHSVSVLYVCLSVSHSHSLFLQHTYLPSYIHTLIQTHNAD